MFDLRTLVSNPGGWTLLSEAWDIKSSGQIVGFGTFNGSRNEVFLLTPFPELSSALCLLAVTFTACNRRSRRKSVAGTAQQIARQFTSPA